MIRVLVNAYACSPNMGSEPGMGWNWCVNLAKYCELFIITEEEFREKIEAIVPTLPQGKNMHFYYNPVTPEVRKMCWNQGDWRFYWHYRKWQQRTLEIANKICEEQKIDILHQLNMIGYREPGLLWKIKGPKFVWGPVGGMETMPILYLKGAGCKTTVFNVIKNKLNIFQIRYYPRITHALNNADALISSIPDSYYAIKRYTGKESIIIPETGCRDFKQTLGRSFEGNHLDVVWAGKFDYRKRIDIAIKAVAQSGNENIHLHIYGTGNDKQVNEVSSLISTLHIDNQVTLHGNMPHDDVEMAMQSAHLFFFTSVSEDTSTVVLEAISNGLPVLCFDTCGMSAVIDDSVGKKISLSNPEQSIKEFAHYLNHFYQNRNELYTMSANCQQKSNDLSWENKGFKIMNIYKHLTEKNKI